MTFKSKNIHFFSSSHYLYAPLPLFPIIFHKYSTVLCCCLVFFCMFVFVQEMELLSFSWSVFSQSPVSSAQRLLSLQFWSDSYCSFPHWIPVEIFCHQWITLLFSDTIYLSLKTKAPVARTKKETEGNSLGCFSCLRQQYVDIFFGKLLIFKKGKVSGSHKKKKSVFQF